MQRDWFLKEFTKSYMCLTIWMTLALLLLSGGPGTKELSAAQSPEDRVIYFDSGNHLWLSSQVKVAKGVPADAGPDEAWKKIKEGHFEWHGEGSPSFGYGIPQQWLAFDYRLMSDQAEPFLETAFAPLDSVKVYIQRPGESRFQLLNEAGDQIPFEQRMIRHRHVVVALGQETGGTVHVLVDVRTSSSMKVPMHLIDRSVFIEKTIFENLFDGLYFGSILLVSLISLIFYFIFRQVPYLIYISYILAFAMFVASYKGYGAAYIWRDQFELNQYMINFFVFTGSFTMCWFSLSFFKVHLYAPRYSKFIWGYIYLNGVLAAVHWFLPMERFSRLIAMDALLTSLLLTIAAVLVYRKSQSGKLFFWAFLFQFSGIFMGALTTLKLVPSYPAIEYSFQLGSYLQIVLLFISLFQQLQEMRNEKDQANEERIRLQEKNQAQLAEWNEALKMRVEERTFALQQLLDHAQEGYFKIGSDLTIGSEYSAQCTVFYGKAIEGLPAATLICQPDDPNAHFLVTGIVKDLFKADSFRRSVYLNLLPDQVIFGSCTLKLVYRWVDARPGSEAHVLVIATDVSREVELNRQLETDRKDFEMVAQVFSDQDAFIELIGGMEELTEQIPEAAAASNQQPAAVLTGWFRNVHTLKGLSHQLKMVRSGKALHQLEECFVNDQQVKHEEFVQVRDAWRADLTVLRKWMGEGILNPSFQITVGKEKLISLRERLKSMQTSAVRDEMLDFIAELLRRPVRDMLSAYPGYIERMAATFDKWIAPLELDTGSIRVDPDVYQSFFRTLVHIFRNQVDHGIESAEERISAGKQEQGLIRVYAKEAAGQFVLELSDDGRGLDLNKIKNRAVELGLAAIDVAEQMTDPEITGLIWLDGLSTTEKANELSGRGIGMAAVKEQAELLGGTVEVESTMGKGTLFRFRFPLKEKESYR